jgi:hypothetical protein
MRCTSSPCPHPFEQEQFQCECPGSLGVVPEENDIVDIIRGVGGAEYVYVKKMKKIV